MTLSQEQKTSFLANIKNELFLLDEILIPLFTNMGKFKVNRTHGPDEKGKDIVLVGNGDFGEKTYTAVIVKNDPITNASTNLQGKEIVATVSNQIVMTINSGYDSIEENRVVKFNTIIILTSKSISNSARQDFVKIANEYKFTNLIFWEADELIKSMDKYLPEIYLVSSGVLSKYFHLLKDKCDNLIELKKISIYKGEEKNYQIYIIY